MNFKSRNTRTQIDYFLRRANSKRLRKDCKVIPRECLTTQHRLLVMDIEVRSSIKRMRTVCMYMVRWWNLNGENVTKLVEKVKSEGKCRLGGDANRMWE